ncbi:EAL domain-containing protein [Pseudoxanthomonas composti]|uniref:EAL domain-containing protein n=1 Tax=Pseudoxanthomonas composti TaxID=2137479 RepID=A0A4Q1JTA1_9GAMM|nr:EAL domain-containing protein [Pseudoxanthomonas composti]
MWRLVPDPTLSTDVGRLGAESEDLRAMVERARSGQMPLMLLHLELDHFESVGETMGLDVSGQALLQLAQRLTRFVEGRGRVWRHSVEQFILAIERSDMTVPPEQIAEALCDEVELPLTVLPYTLFLNAKAGVSLCPEHTPDATTLLDFAELSTRLLTNSPDRIQFYSGQSSDRAHSESAISRQIIDALPNGELRLRYQPEVNARDGRIIGMEALLRWHSPGLGLMVPERFMPTAERLGVVVQIGTWVLETALRQCRAWRDQGFDDFFMAVNVSTLQLLRPEFVDEVLALIQSIGVPPQSLLLEINESALTNNVSSIFDALSALRREGVLLGLDNFGMGDSSLNALVRYPVDTLKIDRSFIKTAPASEREAAIVRAIIAMGHQLNMRVIANGVESDVQLGYLRRGDCDIFQGYLFGEPMPADAASLALRRRYLRPELFAASKPDRTLLLLDDEENVLRALVRLFRRDGYRILIAGNVRDAFDLLATNDVQVILSDQRMSDMSGTEFLGRVKMLYPNTVRLVLSGYTDLATVTDAINRGAIYRFLTKPWNDQELQEHIRQAFRTWDEQYGRATP